MTSRTGAEAAGSPGAPERLHGLHLGRTRWSAWDLFLILLLLGSVALVFWHAEAKDAQVRSTLLWLDLAICLFFVVEWAWRGVRSGHPASWGLRHAWELLGMIPIVAPLPAFLRVLRLARLVRVLRVFGALGQKLGTWERIAQEGNLKGVALASASITLVGSLLVWLFERDENPDFVRYSEALWWAVVTVTTVGYGDITPVTGAGRVVAGLLMAAGIGTIGLLASTLAGALVKDDARAVRDEEAQAAPARPGRDLVGDLQALATLHAAGKLSDAEYAAAKRRLLG